MAAAGPASANAPAPARRDRRFIQTALGDLFRDDNFVNLLRAEGLDTAPKYIRDRVKAAAR